jgi:2-oxoglutarate/2-oxoacid ferredoxin oxidoreductase subunit alpha
MPHEIPAFFQSTGEVTRNEVINDFSITFCTTNGSGSATANTTLLRALFQLGIPVSGKNIFPSNIQGLPTWYSIRVNKDGFLARSEKTHIVVAMNSSSYLADQDRLIPGGVFFHSEDIKIPIHRDDIICYPLPVKRLSKESDTPSNLRDYIANMVYVGVISQMLGIPLEQIGRALAIHFHGKRKAIELNYSMVEKSAEWAKANLVKQDPFRVEAMNLNQDGILADGNLAGALGAIYGGVQFMAWYPITPASALAENVNEYLPILRKDPVTGKDTCVVVQAEDEIAAAGMVTGAGWGGLRAMTSTSGPGLSLMTEYIGLAYLTEVPMVVWDIQRVGPSTGMPTRTAQCDLTMANFLGHGDTHYIILLPGTVTECFEFGWKAFDLAEHFQTPVIVLSDLDLGMNQWSTPKFVYPETPLDRGKVLWEEDLQKLEGVWIRYQDIDGDGVAYRTVMGNHHPQAAYFTRGTGHDPAANYSENPEDWEQNTDRIKRKFDTARNMVPKPILDIGKNNLIGLVGMGSTDLALQEARFLLQKEGIEVDFLRIRALPFSNEIYEFFQNHDRCYVIELNQDGQLHQLLTLAFPEIWSRLVSLAYIDGLPLTAEWILKQIKKDEERSS